MRHIQNMQRAEGRMELLANAANRMMKDGLNQTKYELVEKVVTDFYTKISVDLLYTKYEPDA